MTFQNDESNLVGFAGISHDELGTGNIFILLYDRFGERGITIASEDDPWFLPQQSPETLQRSQQKPGIWLTTPRNFIFLTTQKSFLVNSHIFATRHLALNFSLSVESPPVSGYPVNQSVDIA